MKSETPKVLFEINDEPLCFAGMRALFELCSKIVVVVGYKGEEVKLAIQTRAREEFGDGTCTEKLIFVTQDPPRGTGDAVKMAIEGYIKSAGENEEILVLNGDLPLVRKSTLQKFVRGAQELKVVSACLAQRVRNPKGLGRILRDETGVFMGIREEKDSSADEKKIGEINGGVYYFKHFYLAEELKKLNVKNAQNEFYLTDILGNRNRARPSAAVSIRSPLDLMGVNTTVELSEARRIAQYRLQRKLCEEHGLDLLDPSTAYLSSRAKFGNGCAIGPNVVIKGACVFAEGVRLDGNNYIQTSEFAASAHVLWGSVVEHSKVGERASVGPMAHLRPQTELGADVKIGNFVELKKTKMKRGSKASHLTYLGDAEVGEDSNIGCGVITCNYDGFSKHVTVIGDRAFIGSDTQLIAPVTIGNGAYVGSGTTVTNDVPEGALALSRTEMVIKEGYAKKIEAKRLSLKKAKSS